MNLNMEYVEYKLNLDNDAHCIPFPCVLEVLNKLPYACTERVIFQMLALTGCRLAEINHMEADKVIGEYILWHLGKNQRSFRKVKLPKAFLQELAIYRRSHRVSGKLFGISDTTFRRYFSKLRRSLSSPWKEIRFHEVQGKLQPEYVLQLKGLRKNFQTLEFAKQYEKWQDSQVALLFTSKSMKHHSTHMTAYHYLESFEALEIDKYKHLRPEEIYCKETQKRLFEF
jgi:integrase